MVQEDGNEIACYRYSMSNLNTRFPEQRLTRIEALRGVDIGYAHIY